MIEDITIVDKSMLGKWDSIGEDDRFLTLLQSQSTGDDLSSVSHRWLLESMPKRMVYSLMYINLLHLRSRAKSIVDVGSGYSSLSRLLASYHEYHPVDLQLSGTDWYTYNCPDVDLIIANDLFPNVDQRLELFLGKFLPHCKEMRLSLTYFNHPKWYTLKRADGNEVLTMLAWTGKQIKEVLDKYNPQGTDLTPLLYKDVPSIFPNARQVAIVCLKGNS